MMLGSLYSATEIQALEKKAFGEGVDGEALMDQAGAAMARLIQREESTPGLCVVFAGRGHNAGDAFVAAAHLEAAGWEVWVRALGPVEERSALARKKAGGLSNRARQLPGALTSLPAQVPAILLDGLLGIGTRLPLRDDVRSLARELNHLRQEFSARVYAVDVPTGVTDEGIDPDTVRADLTMTVTFPKAALLRDKAADHVGRLRIIELAELAERADPSPPRPFVSYPGNLRALAPLRHFDSHKGEYGRIGLVAGSRDYPGAARLCATAAARAGGGLINLYVLPEAYPFTAVSLPPEIIIRQVDTYAAIVHDRLDAIGLGPGLGHDRGPELLDLIENFPGPMVVDADGLNLIAQAKPDLHRWQHPRLFTPHPGEMARLWQTQGRTRAEILTGFTSEYPVTLLLKGSRTLIGEKGRPLAYNSTGTPGQATGGSGDVLTGVCAALLGRGLSCYDAARLGAWLCGRASELAVRRQSEEAMLPTDTIACLGPAFQDLRSR
ncbi:MAG TPA: NAD(P)H-hydrate dehydratase [Chthoniobacterales bacterium]